MVMEVDPAFAVESCWEGSCPEVVVALCFSSQAPFAEALDPEILVPTSALPLISSFLFSSESIVPKLMDQSFFQLRTTTSN